VVLLQVDLNSFFDGLNDIKFGKFSRTNSKWIVRTFITSVDRITSVRPYYLAIHVLLSVLKYFQSCVRTYGSYDINIYLDLDLDIFVLDSGDVQTCNRVFVRNSGSYPILFGISVLSIDILFELSFFSS
jgi:hypothetical protein